MILCYIVLYIILYVLIYVQEGPFSLCRQMHLKPLPGCTPHVAVALRFLELAPVNPPQ